MGSPLNNVSEETKTAVRSWKRQKGKIVLLGVLIFLFWPGSALAAVDLEDFFVIPQNGRVQLEWETNSEIGVSVYYMRRSTINNQDYENWDRISIVDQITGLPREFIGARDPNGAVYTFRDENLQNGNFYCYTLEVENTDQTIEFFPGDPQCVIVGQPAATTTATANLTPSATATITATPTRTNTPVPLPTTSTPAMTQVPSETSLPTPVQTGTIPVTVVGPATPLPTFLPTYTPTRTRTPTPSKTPTVTVTGGALLESTREPGTPPPGIAGLGGDADLTLRTLILRVVALSAVVGGCIFAGLYYVVVRRGQKD